MYRGEVGAEELGGASYVISEVSGQITIGITEKNGNHVLLVDARGYLLYYSTTVNVR